MSKEYLEFQGSISKLPIRVGSINYSQQGFLLDYLKKNTDIKNVLETGFHVGLSAAVMMEARPDIRVVSSDIFWFDYTRKAKLFLDIAYPGRNTLIAGNSVNTLPTLFTQVPFMPDFVFIDGGHERPVPYIDLYYILNHIRPGTPIMIDDYCLEHGQHGVIDAVNWFIHKGVLCEAQVYKAEDRGWVFGKRSDAPMPPSDFDLSAKSIDKVLRDTESHYSASQGEKDPSQCVLNVQQAKEVQEAQKAQKTMDFTFGIITGGNADEYIQKAVDSIRSQAIPKYEIIIVGKTSVKGADITVIPFDETVKNIWHTKKKNLIIRFSKYENVVLTYDYIVFEKGWYEGFIKFGKTFSICVNKMFDMNGRRFRDHVLFSRFLDNRFNETLLIPYGCKLTPAVSKLLYISGAYCVIKKEIGLKYPFREELHWGHGEDVIHSHTLSENGILLECNAFSTVTLIKEKYFWEREMSVEVYEELCKYAETCALFERQKAFQIDWHLKDFGIDLRV
jgi:predicted O-methyltransferase YrrM